MNREQKTVKTPSGIEVVLNAYVTGREKREMRNIFMREDLKPIDQYNLAQDVAYKIAVISINGFKEGDLVEGKPFSIVDAVLDMREADTKFITKEVNDITSDKGLEEKKTL